MKIAHTFNIFCKSSSMIEWMRVFEEMYPWGEFLVLRRFAGLVSFLIRKSYWFFFPLCKGKNMSVLTEDKTTSGTGSFVVSYFAFSHYISRLGFILFLAFILLSRIQRIFNTWRLLLFLWVFCSVHVCYRKKQDTRYCGFWLNTRKVNDDPLFFLFCKP